MADKKTFEEMVGRAVTDQSFRGKLIQDPKGTIDAEGYEVSDEALKILQSIDATAADAAVKDLETKFGAQKAAW